MKKILIAVFATLLLAAYVVPSMALDTTFDGQYRVRGIYTENFTDANDDALDESSWLDQRFRLGIIMKEAPVTGYLQLQLGGGGANSSKVWGVDATTGALQVRQAYLDFPVGPVGVKLGRTYASHGFLGGGMFENIADRFVFSYKVSDDLNLSFIHAKGREAKAAAEAAGANDQDRNIFNLGGTYKLGALGDASARVYYVRDGARYITQTGTSVATDIGSWSATWLTAQANLKFNPVNVNVSGAFLSGESNPAAGSDTYDISGYAVHGDVNASFGPAKVGAVVGMGSGDDDKTDKKLDTFFAPGGASYIQSHLFFQSGENNYSTGSIVGSNLNTQNGSRETLSNVTWAGLYGEYMIIDDLTLGGRIATFSQTEALTEATAPTNADDIGTELDLTANYKLHKNLTLLAAAAWFMPGDAYSGQDVTAAAKDDTITALYSRLQWTF